MIKKENKPSINCTLNHRGFTLAETLITLVIVGVVAALTVPTLIHKYRVQQYKSGFQKAYSILGQAVNSMSKDYGSLLTTDMTTSEFKDNLQKYLVCDKRSDYRNSGAIDGKVYYKNKLIKPLYTRYANEGNPYPSFVDPFCTLNNGMLIFVAQWTHPLGATSYIIGADTNGFNKGPNRWGYDFFTFGIYTKKPYMLQPLRYSSCSKNYTGDYPVYNGAACAHYAAMDKNPDDETKGYWDSL